MAKNPTLTINVNAAQFNQFTKDFNDFTKKLGALSGQFKQIASSVSQTNQKTQQMSGFFGSLLDMSNKFHKRVDLITTQFGKWTTLIGSVVMLASGGGFWGLNRLSQTIVDRQRQMLTLGGSWGANQAALRAGQITGANTFSTLENIQKGLMGDMDMRNALMALRLYDRNKTPEQIYQDLLRTLPEDLAKHPGRELLWARSRGLTKIMPEDEIMRYAGPEGKSVRDMVLKQMQNRPMDVSKKARDEWTEFQQALSNLRTNIDNWVANTIGESSQFKTLREHIEKLNKWITEHTLTENLWKGFQDASRKTRDDAHKEIMELMEYISSKFKEYVSGPLSTFKTLMDDLIARVGEVMISFKDSIMNVVDWLWKKVLALFGGGGDREVGTAGGTNDDYLAGASAAAGAGAATSGPYTPTAPSTPLTTSPTPLQNWKGGPGASAVPHLGLPGMPGLKGSGGLLPPGPTLQGVPSIPSMFGQAGSTNKYAVNNRNHLWAMAANNATPPRSSRGGGMALSTQLASADDTPAKRARRAPLDIRNWQVNRVASLTVNNVPGSNVFLTANSMAG